jgi:guanidinoacetate N-methyltransferase
MQSWEMPLMHRMAAVCRPGDRVLEVGFGLGISASAIQSRNPSLHVIVEANLSVAARARQSLKHQVDCGAVKIIDKLWQDASSELMSFAPYDFVVFDAFPLEASELRRTHFSFFAVAAQLLKPLGRFTYFSDERTSLSAGHEWLLRTAFPDCRITTEPVLVTPVSGCEYWRDSRLLHVEVQVADTPTFSKAGLEC